MTGLFWLFVIATQSVLLVALMCVPHGQCNPPRPIRNFSSAVPLLWKLTQRVALSSRTGHGAEAAPIHNSHGNIAAPTTLSSLLHIEELGEVATVLGTAVVQEPQSEGLMWGREEDEAEEEDSSRSDSYEKLQHAWLRLNSLMQVLCDLCL